MVDLLGQLQPQHVLLAVSDHLHIQQLLVVGVAHVSGVTDGARPQGQGGSHVEVVQIADTAEAGGLVDDDTAGGHTLAEGLDHVLLDGIDVHGGGVTGTTLVHQLGADVEGLVQILGAVHTQQGGQLLVGPGVIVGSVIGLVDHDLGLNGNGDAGHLSQLQCGLADGGGLDAVVLGIEEHLGHLGGLVVVQEVAAGVLHQGLDLVIDAVQDGDVLLGGADHTIIEGLGMDDGLHGHTQVSTLVDDDVTVTGAHADGGGAGGVGGVNHAGTTGCHDDIHLLHQGVGQLDAGDADPTQNMGRHTGCDGGLTHDVDGRDGAVDGMGVGGQDQGISGLQGQHDLIDRGRGGVGGGGDGGDDALGTCNTHGAEGLVLLDHTAGLLVAHVVPDVLGCVLVLGDLIHHDTVAGFVAGHLCQRDSHLGNGHGRLLTDGVDLLLGEGCVLCLRGADNGQGFFKCFDRIDQQCLVFHNHTLLL